MIDRTLLCKITNGGIEADNQSRQHYIIFDTVCINKYILIAVVALILYVNDVSIEI